MKRILASGDVGFVGSHLCTRLINEGHDVICLGNFFTGSKEDIVHSVGDHHFEVVYHDIVFPYSTEIGEICNPACPASPIHCQYDAIQTIKASVMGAINVLRLARRLNAKILQTSAGEAYGDPEVHPQPKSYWGNANPIGIRSCYDEGKHCSETLFMDYHRQNNVRIRVVRIFSTYGPRMLPYDGRVASNFVIQTLKSDGITVYGTDKQTHSFQYVDDLIGGMIRMMNTGDDFTGPINLGNPSEFPMLQLAETIVRKTGLELGITFKPLPHDDPQQCKPDISLAQEKLGWQPTVLLDEGLNRMIDYFKKKHTL